MTIWEAFATRNPCYIKNAAGAYAQTAPAGIIVHSTGANNPWLKRYVNDPEHCGTNIYGNHWDNPGVQVCVHAFIGKDINGNIGIAQLLPWEFSAWGVGSGTNGSFNYSPRHIQFEICEDALTDETYFIAAFDAAAELCAYLCRLYNMEPDDVISHAEAFRAGYGSNHADPEHWLKRHGKNMNWFRALVASKTVEPKADSPEQIYRVGTGWADGRCVGQIGAYKNIGFARDACPDGYKVFDSSGAVVYSRVIEVGSDVEVLEPIVFGTGKRFKAYYPVYKVKSLTGDRAVIAWEGIVVAAIAVDNLKLI